jgi:hypothetical protein
MFGVLLAVTLGMNIVPVMLNGRVSMVAVGIAIGNAVAFFASCLAVLYQEQILAFAAWLQQLGWLVLRMAENVAWWPQVVVWLGLVLLIAVAIRTRPLMRGYTHRIPFRRHHA